MNKINQNEDFANDCVFCKIISGELPSHKVYEDEHTLAFLDNKPVNHGHCLVIPKDHFENIYTTPDETWARTLLTVRKVAVAIKNACEADGINISMNNEAAAGQVIWHSHIHIIPRFEGDKDRLPLWPQQQLPSDPVEIAKKISLELL